MHTDAHQLYSVLGVDPAASSKAIGSAFRRRAKQLHPDAPSGDAGAFIRLKQAYDVLSDPLRRADYDRACQPPEPEPHGAAEPYHAHAAASHHAPEMDPRRWESPPQPRSWRKARSRGGIGIGRYVIAFIIMAAISLGGVQAMISFTQAPPSIRARPAAPVATLAAPAPATEPSSAPGSSKSGFWDPSPPPASRN